MNKEYKKRLIFESSLPGTMSLLFEDESQVEAAQEYSKSAVKAIKVRLEKITSLVGSLPAGGYRSGLESLISKSLGEKINDVVEKSKGLTDPSDNLESAAKEAGVLANEIDEASKDINTTIKINLALMRYMATQILKSNLHKGEDKDIPMEEILKGTDEKLLDVAIKELGEAFDAAFKKIPASKEKGFFAKLGDTLFGSDEPVFEKLKENKDELIKSILELTPIEIGTFAQAIVKYGKEDNKEAEKVKKQSSEAKEGISDEAAGDEDKESKDKGASISKKDLMSNAEKIAGSAGTLVVDRLLKSDFFKEFNITESLRNVSLQVLLEQKISAEDYTNIVAQAMEDNEDAFKDVDSRSLAKDLNKVFRDSNVDVEIEEKPLTWNDLDGKGKRRAQLGFYLVGEYKYGGTPSESTMETLLFTYQRAGYNAEDLADTDVDINNQFSDQNGKGAEKLGDIPELVDVLNAAADKKEEYREFKLKKEEKPKEYTIEKLEDLISKAFKTSNPDWENQDFADKMVMALSTYIQEEVSEVSIVSEGRLMIYEKYDFKAVKDFMASQLADFDAGQKDDFGTEDVVFSQFLKGVAPALSKIGIEISGIPASIPDEAEATEDVVEESRFYNRLSLLAGIK